MALKYREPEGAREAATLALAFRAKNRGETLAFVLGTSDVAVSTGAIPVYFLDLPKHKMQSYALPKAEAATLWRYGIAGRSGASAGYADIRYKKDASALELRWIGNAPAQRDRLPLALKLAEIYAADQQEDYEVRILCAPWIEATSALWLVGRNGDNLFIDYAREGMGKKDYMPMKVETEAEFIGRLKTAMTARVNAAGPAAP